MALASSLILYRDEIKAQENQTREAEVEHVTTEDGQPFFMIDRRGRGFVNSFKSRWGR